MKQLLLWLIGVALGVVVLLAAVLGVSYSFTSEGAKPASEVQFAGQELDEYERLLFGEDTAAPAEEEPAETEDEAAPAEDTAE